MKRGKEKGEGEGKERTERSRKEVKEGSPGRRTARQITVFVWDRLWDYSTALQKTTERKEEEGR